MRASEANSIVNFSFDSLSLKQGNLLLGSLPDGSNHGVNSLRVALALKQDRTGRYAFKR